MTVMTVGTGDEHVTASPSAGREPIPALGTQAALSVLTFDRGPGTDQARWAELIRRARCADSGVDADQWFPVSNNPESAVSEAADALAVCRSCPVRSLCLALSLLHWDVGQYGVWGGLVAADRASLRRQMLAPGSPPHPEPSRSLSNLPPRSRHV
jgi:WhiB family redox-sensing transcriptional regulator